MDYDQASSHMASDGTEVPPLIGGQLWIAVTRAARRSRTSGPPAHSDDQVARPHDRGRDSPQLPRPTPVRPRGCAQVCLLRLPSAPLGRNRVGSRPAQISATTASSAKDMTSANWSIIAAVRWCVTGSYTTQSRRPGYSRPPLGLRHGSRMMPIVVEKPTTSWGVPLHSSRRWGVGSMCAASTIALRGDAQHHCGGDDAERPVRNSAPGIEQPHGGPFTVETQRHSINGPRVSASWIRPVTWRDGPPPVVNVDEEPARILNELECDEPSTRPVAKAIERSARPRGRQRWRPRPAVPSLPEAPNPGFEGVHNVRLVSEDVRMVPLDFRTRPWYGSKCQHTRPPRRRNGVRSPLDVDGAPVWMASGGNPPTNADGPKSSVPQEVGQPA